MAQTIMQICDRLHQGSNARAVVILDDSGNVVGQAGDASLQPADVSSRKAPLANASAPIGAFHESAGGTLYILNGPPLTIGVLFDESSSPGLVRLRVREARVALATIEAGNPRN